MCTNHPCFTYTVWALRWHYPSSSRSTARRIQGATGWLVWPLSLRRRLRTFPGKPFPAAWRARRGLGTASTKLRGANRAWPTLLPSMMRRLAAQTKCEQWVLFVLTLARTLPGSRTVIFADTLVRNGWSDRVIWAAYWAANAGEQLYKSSWRLITWGVTQELVAMPTLFKCLY